MHFLKSTALARPHQVLLERKIDDFSHKEAGDDIPAVAARFPHSDVSADSDLDPSRLGFFFISLVLGPLNSLLGYVPS